MANMKQIAEAVLVTQMTLGTSDAFGGAPAKVVLASFVNGVRMALLAPEASKRLSDAAERLIEQDVNAVPSSDSTWTDVVDSLVKSLDAIDQSF